MLHKTGGIVLRSVKYGDTSLVVTIFTRELGVQAFMVQGVRTTSATRNKAAYFHPGMVLDLVLQVQQQKQIHRIREYAPAIIFKTVQEQVVKNCILLFSVEVMLRLLPEHAPQTELFDLAVSYFELLDGLPVADVANMPLHFLVNCGRIMGYELRGSYSSATPYLDQDEGGFSEHPPKVPPFTTMEDAECLYRIESVEEYGDAGSVRMNAETRFRLLDWYVSFLQRHSGHMADVRSLQVLHAVLH